MEQKRAPLIKICQINLGNIGPICSRQPDQLRMSRANLRLEALWLDATIPSLSTCLKTQKYLNFRSRFEGPVCQSG